MKIEKLALDRGSVRHYSEDGHLHVETSHISKAMVCPYYGREIPDCEGLGLDPEKIYYLYRDAEELEKAAPTFAGKPILLRHTPVSSDDHPRDITVGSIGDNVTWNAPYLDASLHIWDEQAIAGIETKKQTELSCGYHYDADMTAGEFEGTPYDGVMRNIRGNHLALVDVGRAGSDVVVGDRNPFNEMKENLMKKSQRFKALMQKVIGAKKSGMALDADIEEIQDVLEAVQPLLEQVEDKLDDVSDEVDGDEDVAEDDDDIRTLDEIPEDERDEWEPVPDREGYYRRKTVAEDGDIDDDKKDDDKEGKKEMGMDRATVQRMIDRETAKVRKAMRAEAKALVEAQEKVRPLVGSVMGMDSAADVYRFALKEKGISTKGIHPSALPAMVDMALRQGQPARTIAQDSAAQATANPLLARIKVTG